MTVTVTVSASSFGHLELRLGVPVPSNPFEAPVEPQPVDQMYAPPEDTLGMPPVLDDDPSVRYAVPSSTV